MKIVFLTDSLSDLDGVGRYTMRLIAAMQELEPGLEPIILLARKHRPTSKSIPKDWHVEVALPPDYFFYMTRTRFLISRLQSVWRVWQHAKGADLIHAIKDYPHNLVGAQAAHLAKIPCVATAHGTYSVQPLLDDRHEARARKTYGAFKAMISVSNYTRRRLVELLAAEDGGPQSGGLDPKHIHVVPNCVDAAHYVEDRGIGHRDWHDVPFTLGIGEVKERKGHHLSLAAFLRVAIDYPDLHHFLVGRLSGDVYEDNLRKLAKDAGMEQRVHFLGNIEEDEKVDLLQRAEIFVHTPVTADDGGFEGFGIVYLEASASGTVCIGSLDCGAEDAIKDGETGLLVDQSVDAVEVGLRQLMGDADMRSRMGQAGRSHAGDVTWKMNAKRVLAIYRDVLGESKRS
jgi:glycosyltransferase involved in cell wall biosynthesis